MSDNNKKRTVFDSKHSNYSKQGNITKSKNTKQDLLNALRQQKTNNKSKESE